MKRGHELYLIRHGVAEERGSEWPDDAKRPLTDEGAMRLRKSARSLRQLEVIFDVILTSPLVRARQRQTSSPRRSIPCRRSSSWRRLLRAATRRDTQ